MPFNAEFSAEHINIRFQQSFDYEDIDELANQVIGLFTHNKVVEVIPGADRMNYRIYWRENNYVINFEVYSQSCWLEVETSITSEPLALAFQVFQGAQTGQSTGKS